jgi:hypothetical protein
LFRSYSPGFSTFYGQGPGTGSKTSNQTGIVGNFTFEAAKHLFIYGGSEIVYYPWLHYRSSSPSLSTRREIMIKYNPLEKVSVNISYNYSLTMNDNEVEQGIPEPGKILSRSIKASFHYSVHDNLTFGIKADIKHVNPSVSKGYLLAQDINYSFTNIPVTIWIRYCLFKTNDWASRIYTYENDLLYSFSIPALSGKGSRSYLMVKWKISDFAEMRVKYGITSVLTSENTAKETDEIKIQFRVRF